MRENCIKGYVTVSPYGASTCNSEYEFLTGNDMLFLPQHSSVFPEFVLSKQDSIIRWMDSLGFDTTSYIPNLPTDYNNSAVLQYLGIQTQYYMQYIKDNGISLTPSPAHNIISDESLFINLADMIDTKLDSSKPNYVYSLTVQEHGDYDYDIENTVGFSEPYSKTAYCYINIVNDTNNALQWLINHYKNSDRKVVIVMYGDHYPWLGGWIESNTKYDLNSLEESSRLYQTPFLIWTNQDIGYTWIDDISLNYLSNEVFKVAGIPLSPMQKWLEECRKELPIITEWGYKTADGVWHSRGEEYDADSILNKYHILQWYRMFDENRKILQK